MAGSVLDRQVRLAEVVDLASLTEVCRGFAELFAVGVKLLDGDGRLLLDVQAPGAEFCAFVFARPVGRQRCGETISHCRADPLPGPDPGVWNCFSGCRFLGLPLVHQGEAVGRIVLGPYCPAELSGPAPALAATSAYDPEEARALMARMRKLPDAAAGRALTFLCRALSVLVFTGHKAWITEVLHVEAVTEDFRALQEKSEKLARALDERKELDRLKSRFLATVSHELRTPLTSVIGYSEMMLAGLAGDLSAEQRDYLQTILDKGESLLNLITSILDLSKVEAQGVALRLGTLEIPELVKGAVSTVLPLAHKKGLTLTCELASGLPALRADAEKIHQCLLNLLSNAIKFTPAGGQVRVVAGPARPGLQLQPDPGPFAGAGQVEIRVEDTGIGIAPELHQKIFDTFFQADSSAAREFGGAGLGLSIVKSYIEAHGGRVVVESAPGRGSAFSLVLPVGPVSGREA